MTDIYNDITALLIAESTENYITLGAQCIISGFVLCSLLSLLSYGIFKAISLVNIKSY